ncbi:MAG TPA: PAS domain-containing protein, partial [Thermoanaerobaculia bacterium]|nr:PAS domain-containing protein [Thermoanaerobaculia bacterium]
MKASLVSDAANGADVVDVPVEDRVVGFDSHFARRKLVEDELRSSREQLAIAQRIGRIGTWEYDLATKRRTASDELYRIFDLDPAVGADLEPFDARIHPDDYQRVCAARMYVAAQHEPIVEDVRIVLRDGEVRTLHTQVGYVHDDEGNLLKITGVVQDVTDARATQHELVRRAVQQAAVANLGQTALGGASMEEVARLASTLVTQVLDVDLCAILEATANGFLVVQGNDFAATLHELDVANGSQAAHAVRTNAPVIVDDLRSETRFVPSPMLLRMGVVSGVSVPVTTG